MTATARPKILQLLDLPPQRRGQDVERPRRAAEMQRLGGGEKTLQLRDVHVVRPVL